MYNKLLFYALQRQLSCNEGFTLSADEKQCIKIETAPATPPTVSQGVVGKAESRHWNKSGARIYRPGYPSSGNGVVLQNLIIPHFWTNGDFQSTQAGANNNSDIYQGRMNINGIWVVGQNPVGGEWTPVNEWIGFTSKIVLTSPKRVYIGIAGDNYFKVNLNGQVLIDSTLGVGINFNWWEIYPIDLIGSVNYVEMFVKNYSSGAPGENPAGFACEIYDMTATQLIQATSPADLAIPGRIIFSTLEMVGDNWDLGETIGYSCDPGWALENNGGEYSCKLITIEQPS